jgi:hypothetical protein
VEQHRIVDERFLDRLQTSYIHGILFQSRQLLVQSLKASAGAARSRQLKQWAIICPHSLHAARGKITHLEPLQQRFRIFLLSRLNKLFREIQLDQTSLTWARHLELCMCRIEDGWIDPEPVLDACEVKLESVTIVLVVS